MDVFVAGCYRCDTGREIKGVIVPGYDSIDFRRFTGKQEFDKSLNTLRGIIKGISIDGIINATEIAELSGWLEDHKEFSKDRRFNSLFELIAQAIKDNILEVEEVKDINWSITRLLDQKVFYDDLTSCIQELEGVFHGILADNVITDAEIEGLDAWIESNSYMEGHYPYDEIYSIMLSIRNGKPITEDHRNILKVFFSQFSEKHDHSTIDNESIKGLQGTYNLKGICCTDPKIEFRGKLFCFTGKSSKSTRAKIIETITTNGGDFSDHVSQKTDYLVYGNAGNPSWSYSCYGRKVEEAIQLRKTGHHIQIVNEDDFWDKV